jgi:hypothetical protein
MKARLALHALTASLIVAACGTSTVVDDKGKRSDEPIVDTLVARCHERLSIMMTCQAKSNHRGRSGGRHRYVRALRNFRAGLEVTISSVTRCVGWTRGAWTPLRSFRASA